MTICAPALRTKCVPICTADLIIGTIENTDTELYVYIKDLTTGRTEILNAESDSDGLVILDISAYTFSDNHSYEMWITLSYANVYDKIDVTIGDEVTDTLAPCFVDIESPSGAYVFGSQTLEVLE